MRRPERSTRVGLARALAPTTRLFWFRSVWRAVHHLPLAYKRDVCTPRRKIEGCKLAGQRKTRVLRGHTFEQHGFVELNAHAYRQLRHCFCCCCFCVQFKKLSSGPDTHSHTRTHIMRACCTILQNGQRQKRVYSIIWLPTRSRRRGRPENRIIPEYVHTHTHISRRIDLFKR